MEHPGEGGHWGHLTGRPGTSRQVVWGWWENTLLPAGVKWSKGRRGVGGGQSKQWKGERGSVPGHSQYRRNTFLSPNKAAGALL